MLQNSLKLLRKQAKLSQNDVAKAMNLSQGAISAYEQGLREPNLAILQNFADLYGVTVDYLLDASAPKRRTVKIRIYGDVAAGQPIGAADTSTYDDPRDWCEIPADMAGKADYFALRIKGDSMAPRMQEGDIVICRKQATADSGDICVVLVDNETATCKKIKKTDEGITLIGLNPAFTPLFFSWREVAEKPVSVLGLVVELRAQF